MTVPKTATPTVPPTCRAELRTPEASPAVSGSLETKTPAVIAGMMDPMEPPKIPSPTATGQGAEVTVLATSSSGPIPARANPREIRGRK